MRKLPLGLLGAGLTAALLVLSACGSSSSGHGTSTDAGTDSGKKLDSGTTPTDSGAPDSTSMGTDSGMDASEDTGMMMSGGDSGLDSGMPDATDASDGGNCDFPTVVLGLIKNDTTSSAVPVPISAVTGCTDDMNQMDFAGLF